MASTPHGRLGPPLWSFAADAHDCIMVLVRLDRPHTSSWRDAAPVGGLPLRSLWLIPPGAPCRGRGPQTEPDGGKKPEKKRLTEKAPYKAFMPPVLDRGHHLTLGGAVARQLV